MGIFSGAGSSSGKKKGKAPAVPWRALPPPSSSRPPRQRISVPVHQARWHWEHTIPLPYPDVILPNYWHLDPERIPVPAVPRSARAHAEEVRRRRQQLTPEQRLDPAYAADSPNWEVWFAFEHEEQRRRGVRDVRAGTPPPLIVRDEDQEAEAAYQEALALAAVLRESEEEERRKEEEEEAAYQARMAEAIALSAAGDCVVPPLAPPSPARLEQAPTALTPHEYAWEGVVREWVSAPPIWMLATPKQERDYLEFWRQRHLRAERREGQRLEELEKDAEAEEEERRAEAQAAAVQPPADDVATAWETSFPWAGPAPTLVDLTGPDDDDEDA